MFACRVHHVEEAHVGIRAVEHLALRLVPSDEDAALGVGCGVADVDKHASKAPHPLQTRHTTAVSLRPLASLETLGDGLHVDEVSADWDCCLAFDLAARNLPRRHRRRQASVGRLEGVADVDTIDVKVSDGVVLALVDALDFNLHRLGLLSCLSRRRSTRSARASPSRPHPCGWRGVRFPKWRRRRVCRRLSRCCRQSWLVVE